MAGFDTTKKHDFDLHLVLQTLHKCRLNDGTILLDEYLEAFHELCRFFKLTGRLFGFVADDLERKMEVIETRRKGEHGEYYRSVQSMLEFECNNGFATRKHHLPSGSRTMLRLHWALEFILEFMHRLGKSSDCDKTSTIAAEVYKDTLSHHHPWITRQLASLAVHFLPTRRDLITVMCKQDYETVLDLLEDVVQAGRPIYNTTDMLYRHRNLQNIP